MKEIFKTSLYRTSPRNAKDLEVPRVNQVSFGTHSLRTLGPKIWNKLPEDLKKSITLSDFKRNLKLWSGPTCGCNYCKYVHK